MHYGDQETHNLWSGVPSGHICCFWLKLIHIWFSVKSVSKRVNCCVWYHWKAFWKCKRVVVMLCWFLDNFLNYSIYHISPNKRSLRVDRHHGSFRGSRENYRGFKLFLLKFRLFWGTYVTRKCWECVYSGRHVYLVKYSICGTPVSRMTWKCPAWADFMRATLSDISQNFWRTLGVESRVE